MTLNLVLQACINVAVATASAPTKGISLPFVSYGSSALTVSLFQAGVLLGIARTVGSGDVGSAESEEVTTPASVTAPATVEGGP